MVVVEWVGWKGIGGADNNECCDDGIDVVIIAVFPSLSRSAVNK